MSTYGRNRQSIANIEQELDNIFDNHPKSQINANGDPVIPAENLLDVLQSFSDLYNGQPLLSDEETSMLQELLSQNPGLEVTPQILLGFIAEKTKSTTPPHDEERGRDVHRRDEDYGHSRSLSSDSDGTSYCPGPGSRPPSRGPTTSSAKSPLDSEKRQRSTPLTAAPPSSWSKRPTPAARRKSDAGSRSDGENGTPTWGRSSSRRRTPSHPTSPSTPLHDLSFSPGSPSEHSRPLSRPQSRNTHRRSGGGGFGSSTSYDLGYSSPDDTNHNVKTRPISRYGFNNLDSSFANEVSTLPMPRSSENDSDEEDEIEASLVHDRTAASSTVSMEIHERMEALQRNNEELGRKLMEAERTLQNKLMEHETELEETHMRLEELRSELSLSNREEKELRAKDSRNMGQIAALEAEIAKTQKALDSAKATYSSLQKQYQEQCFVSEKYRDDLRRRDEIIRNLRENAALYEIETAKWQKEHDTYEERLVALQAELNLALQAHTQLDEQKQENLLLKETIDRMRYEMDEMRSATSSGLGLGGSGTSSAMNTLSKTLGAELMGKMKWGAEEEDEEMRRDDLPSDTSTAVETEEDENTEGEEEEDVIQTIITRKRKVASRAREIETVRRTFEEVKEYSDSSTQYDPTLFAVSHGMQTEPERKPVKASFSIQTDPIPVPRPITPPPPRITVEMEIQTEPLQEEPSRSPSPVNDESMASSSSTILPIGPPTPKPNSKSLDPLDEPPAYNQVHEESADREWRLASELLKKWHQGSSVNGGPFEFDGIRGGVSEDTLEEWKTLKQELGVECGVIDKIVAASAVNSAAAVSPPNGKAREGRSLLRRSGRFYNIYNTYVYGDGTGDKNPNSWSSFSGLTSQALMFVGASALVLIAISPYMSPQSSIPGGAMYYDRAAWHSFNSIHAAGEGFVGGGGQDGTAAVWNFLGRVGGGAARMARGWPPT